jgi:hypothetical protein
MLAGLDKRWGFQEAPSFQDNRHMKVVSLSALRIGRIYPPPQPYLTPENISGIHFSWGWFDPRAIVRSAELCRWKIRVTPSGIEPAHVIWHLFVSCLYVQILVSVSVICTDTSSVLMLQVRSSVRMHVCHSFLFAEAWQFDVRTRGCSSVHSTEVNVTVSFVRSVNWKSGSSGVQSCSRLKNDRFRLCIITCN